MPPIIICVGHHHTWSNFGRPGRFVTRLDQVLGIGRHTDKIEIWVYALVIPLLAYKVQDYLRPRVASVQLKRCTS